MHKAKTDRMEIKNETIHQYQGINTSLSKMDITTKQKINKETEHLNNTYPN